MVDIKSLTSAVAPPSGRRFNYANALVALSRNEALDKPLFLTGTDIPLVPPVDPPSAPSTAGGGPNNRANHSDPNNAYLTAALAA